MRQPSSSPKNDTLLPTTGPRSSSTGAGFSRDVGQELRQRLGRIDELRRVGAPRASASPTVRRGVRRTGRGDRAVHQPQNRLRTRRLGRAASPRGARRRPSAGTGAADTAASLATGLAARLARCMSMAPRKCAPSAMATRGEVTSPSTEPLSRMSTFSDAVTLPVTSPRTITCLANTSARIFPLGPIVRVLSRSSIWPSTLPSMVRSSLPLSSPLMITDLPMFTLSLPVACGR